MNIETIFDSFSSKVVILEIFQSAIRKNTDNELDALEVLEKHYKKQNIPKSRSSAIHNFMFRKAKDGIRQNYKLVERNLEERQMDVFFHKNKQYQWLLSETYEYFETFIKEAYAFAGFKNKNYWPMKDFGNITINDLHEKDFDWFVYQTASKKNFSASVLNHFRKLFPALQKIENENTFKINLRLVIVLIEHLRHVIVHNGGLTKDKDKFIENVLKKSGFFNNGYPDQKHTVFIQSYFGTGDYENHIRLIEIYTEQEPSLGGYVDMLRSLKEILISYCDVLKDLLKEI